MPVHVRRRPHLSSVVVMQLALLVFYTRFFYPQLSLDGVAVFQHSPLVWMLQEGGQKQLLSVLQVMHAQACEAGCDSVFLSGEDFENFLVDEMSHSCFEQLVQQAGFRYPEWVLVERDPVDRLQSLYSEFSKHGVVSSIRSWTASVRRTGWFAISTETCHSFMVVDLQRYLPLFLQRTLGTVLLIPFEFFVGNLPVGSELLLRCFGTKWLQSSKVDNLGLQPERVEQKYLTSSEFWVRRIVWMLMRVSWILPQYLGFSWIVEKHDWLKSLRICDIFFVIVLVVRPLI